MPNIKQVIYSNPVTVIIWEDGTKTISRCDDDDVYDELTGFMLCIFKKVLTPKTMRKMFKDYVYDVDSDKIKWQSLPTWLEDICPFEEFEGDLDIDCNYINYFKDAFKPRNAETKSASKDVEDIINYIFDNMDRSVYVL